ncbi:MAG TPA: NAD(P)H-dependent glycerol-3-phosphate dehydrogenase [Gammaproteobacteria bacterium]|nr:NAD(P)H-dependent glycerol-3-phosphate dehydrogenase [Gammaproteobacteria bacterium]
MGATAPIGIVGAGSWGTALAILLARNGRSVRLWSVDRSELDPLPAERENRRYLPGVRFPDPLAIEFELSRLVADCDDLLVVVPSHGFRSTLVQIAACKPKRLRLAWATKGFELESGKLLHEVARETLGEGVPNAVLSGPTFAREVARGMPTAVTIASTDARFAADLAQAVASPVFRAYTSDDLTGVEVGGTVKNIIAIGTGISDGLGFGANARAALITRGLAEITRLGLKLGAKVETFQGLAGLGDLVLTCTDDQSRNRRMGLGLASGKSREQVAKDIGQVVEGVYAAEAVHVLAARLKVEMPICEQLYRILHQGLDPRAAVEALMSRALKQENGR